MVGNTIPLHVREGVAVSDRIGPDRLPVANPRIAAYVRRRPLRENLVNEKFALPCAFVDGLSRAGKPAHRGLGIGVVPSVGDDGIGCPPIGVALSGIQRLTGRCAFPVIEHLRVS